ncbi:MAG: hypothetical protein E3J52_10205 [Promethearchaeota archaeon]|nr:MAG: hypothetical protein E3J52_10205 [Candidatus Lokiarchaeota archaeon]
MLFQDAEPLLFILWLILATVIVALIIYIVVILLESKTKASDKKFLIILLAFIIVLLLPVILNAINSVLGTIGDALADIRNAIDGGGANYLTNLTPIIGFLILLVLVKFLIDIPWDNSVWISLLTLFILYIIYCLIPELYTFLGVGF